MGKALTLGALVWCLSGCVHREPVHVSRSCENVLVGDHYEAQCTGDPPRPVRVPVRVATTAVSAALPSDPVVTIDQVVAQVATEHGCPSTALLASDAGTAWFSVCGTTRTYVANLGRTEWREYTDRAFAPLADPAPPITPTPHDRAPSTHSAPSTGHAGYPHCTRGCACGASCIPCSHICHH